MPISSLALRSARHVVSDAGVLQQQGSKWDPDLLRNVKLSTWLLLKYESWERPSMPWTEMQHGAWQIVWKVSCLKLFRMGKLGNSEQEVLPLCCVVYVE